MLQAPKNAGQDFGLGALNNADISRPIMFVIRALKTTEISRVFGVTYWLQWVCSAVLGARQAAKEV